MTEKAATRKDDGLSEYFSGIQLRNDRWSSLKSVCARLASTTNGKRVEKLSAEARDLLHFLEPIEKYWAFPGSGAFDHLRHLLAEERLKRLSLTVDLIVRCLASGSYRRTRQKLELEEIDEFDEAHIEEHLDSERRPYFEVLIVEDLLLKDQDNQRASLHKLRGTDDRFIYEPVFVPSAEDALIAVLFNYNIQSIVIRPDIKLSATVKLPVLQRYLNRLGDERLEDIPPDEIGTELCRLLNKLRPELDIFLITDLAVEEIAGRDLPGVRRVFYNQEDYLEQHLNILRGVNSRYQTPFFTALKEYSKQPTGVFHAMPISRGKSITRSNWIRDMGEFYGMNIFLAETSATSGGLDSLLEPHGPIKKSQELASRAFGSKKTFFATNGTSTCNKIVVQAIVRPGDIVLVDRDCHKSHHYGMVLSGAEVIYLDSYPLHPYSMYGAVPLKEIKHQLLKLKAAGKLDRVRMLLLTNCTFDGVTYNVERVMQECLAIKPDLVFLWDEAWFAFARFLPTYRQRTAMHCADVLRERYKSSEYRAIYEEYVSAQSGSKDDDLLETRLIPDPDKVRVRAYSTQSTHKTLTSLRQGSMIHVNDQDFRGEVESSFHEAYMTHTSTSPNYQVVASLDVGRRQVELEGYEFVQRQLESAMAIRKAISEHPLLKKYFTVLTVKDMIPEEYRTSGVDSYWDAASGWSDLWDAWAKDEFALDATRVTLTVGGAGIDGDTFKNSILMDKHGIQVNKTSRNTVLFMTNIGTTRSSVAYLIEVLVQVARDLDAQFEDASAREKDAFNARVTSLTQDLPPLPDFSRFHDAFRTNASSTTPEGDIRSAFFLAYDESKCEYYPLEEGAMEKEMEKGRELVSTTFIIPYPPGFPILVPGQVISKEILSFMRALDVKEIHGFRADLGMRVFSQNALDERSQSVRAAAE